MLLNKLVRLIGLEPIAYIYREGEMEGRREAGREREGGRKGEKQKNKAQKHSFYIYHSLWYEWCKLK